MANKGKLSDADRKRITQMYDEGMTQRDIADEFGVSQTSVSYILRRGKPTAERKIERLLAGQLEVLVCIATGNRLSEAEARRLLALAHNALRG